MTDQVTLAAAYLVLSHRTRQRKKKRWWKRTLFQSGPRTSLLSKIKADDGALFKDFTRMSNEDFEHLLQLITPYIQREDTNYQYSISPRMRLIITLRFLATGDSYKSLMYLFEVSFSTISLIVPEVCEAISTVLEDHIKVPKDEGEWKTVAQNFQIKWNYPHCIGAVDGKHVHIICPANTGTEYFNYKKTFSIVLMAIVDANYCFQYVHIGCQGRISDGGVYKNTSFYKELTENRLKIPQPEPLPGREKLTPYVLVADDAFQLTTNCMKPYAGQLPQSPERIFNYRLSRARRIVENAFGIMASVFRVFGKPMQLKVENVEKISKACTYLHNYLRKSRTSRPLYTPLGSFDTEDLENGVIVNGTWRVITSNDTGLTDLPRVPRRPPMDAKLVREEFKEYFMTPQGKVEWQDMYQ